MTAGWGREHGPDGKAEADSRQTRRRLETPDFPVYDPPSFGAAWRKGMPWRPENGPWPDLIGPPIQIMETEMPKMKTKSGAKKRFKFTANGKIKTGQTGKRHRLISNSPARTRDLRGTAVLSHSETQRVKRWMPYG
jgi:large subunit ribosomal protein L35